MKTPVLFLTLCATVLFFPNCSKKDCKPKPASSDAPQIEAYASANGITATRHSSGLYYQIIDPGTGASPTATSNIVITYTGKFMSGAIFDEQTTPNNTPTNGPWALSGLIEGWQIGLPMIKEGGTIKLLVPSSLAYGCEQYYDIPGNSVLFFEIHLVDVQ